MNKGKLKTFAVEARRELLEKVALQARKIGITEDRIQDATVESSDVLIINGQHLSKKERTQRSNLIRRIKDQGYEQVMEEAAYTWFNRFIALRFMEVNDYLPTRVRVLSSLDGGNQPDMMKEAFSLDLNIDMEKVYEMKLNNEDDELFKYLIIAHCNDLNDYLPFMFGTIEDYTEILFPEGLLNTDSFVRRLIDIDTFPEENWHEVEIIGWLYQYYISEENDRLIRAKKAYKPDEIPAVTQLFTPDWIVRYMVQNTIGKQWVEAHPEDRDLIENWEYYLENPNPTIEEQKELDSLVNSKLKVEDIKCIDPAMGSGHALVYMFEVLRQIYEKHGYTNREIPGLIIENNLYGLDIDERAYQLAAFSVVMKGMGYNRNLLKDTKRKALKLNLVAIEETDDFTEEDIQFLAGESKGKSYEKMSAFIEQFKKAKEIGSLLIVEDFDEEFLLERLDTIKNSEMNLIEIGILNKISFRFETLISQARLLSDTYDNFVTNPPYLASKYQTPAIKKYLEQNYKDVKSDLFSSFLYSSQRLTKGNGHIGFMTPYVWMFISSYEKLRDFIISTSTISSLIQLEYSGFDGATVPICTFTLRNIDSEIPGEYIRLSDFVGSKQQPIKTKEAIVNPNVTYRYTFNQSNFKEIPGSPIACWASDNLIKVFKKGDRLADLINPKQGLATADNNKFLRLWWETSFDNIKFDTRSVEESKDSGYKWVPYNKGGKRRQWYGNYDYIVNWENDGKEIRNFKDSNGKLRSRPQNPNYYFKEAITWPLITSGEFSIRYRSHGSIHDVSGMSAFSDNREKLLYILGILSTNISDYIFKLLNPTLNLQVGDFSQFPVVIAQEYKEEVLNLVNEAIQISKFDWDTFETSWDFKKNPLTTLLEANRNETEKTSHKIEDIYYNYKRKTNNLFEKLKKIETKLNQEFIEIYNLGSEVSSDVNDRDITLTKIYDIAKDIPEEIKGNQYILSKKDVMEQFISYAVGCMFGRYSLDEEGLVYAGGAFDISRYKTYKVVKDNIIPITSDLYLEDDIVNCFVDFVETLYGKETLEGNLDFIGEALGQKKNESSRDTIHNYFLKDFFKRHAKMYSVIGSGKRPIYWKFTSGKENAFNCFIYMHRYDKTTISRIRTEYLHDVQQRLETRKTDLDQTLNSDVSSIETNKARKELRMVESQLAELLSYDEKLRHIAEQQIEIDLDDGFNINYPKFKGLVEKV